MHSQPLFELSEVGIFLSYFIYLKVLGTQAAFMHLYCLFYVHNETAFACFAWPIYTDSN
jgi:hypothetical protein